METSLRIRMSELDMGLIETIKRLFGPDRDLTLTIEATSDFGLNTTETKEQYIARLNKAVANLEKGSTVTLTEHELDELVLERMKR